MLLRDARDRARQWVLDEAVSLPGFHGAYFAGSTTWLPDDAPLPASSDLDINVVFAGDSGPARREKHTYRNVLLEINPAALDQVRSPEMVLGDYHLVGGFRTPGIIADPTGHLTKLQRAVARDYATRRWVRRRCEHARRRVLEGIALDASAPFPDQVMSLLFPIGVTTHLLLVAGLRNPTVRRRYVAAREVLAEYGGLAFQETLLELLGSAGMSRTRVEHHLYALTEVFDVAAVTIRTPFPFACDISPIARPLAIDGSREMIAHGFHREAMFWIAVTYSRCQAVLAADAPTDVQARFEGGYRALLSDLGIASVAGRQQRGEEVRSHLDRVWAIAEAIMAANPGIAD